MLPEPVQWCMSLWRSSRSHHYHLEELLWLSKTIHLMLNRVVTTSKFCGTIPTWPKGFWWQKQVESATAAVGWVTMTSGPRELIAHFWIVKVNLHLAVKITSEEGANNEHKHRVPGSPATPVDLMETWERDVRGGLESANRALYTCSARVLYPPPSTDIWHSIGLH
jgi:hypothetical protein